MSLNQKGGIFVIKLLYEKVLQHINSGNPTRIMFIP